MGESRGGGRGYRGCGPPLKNHKYIGFLSNTGPNLLKNHKATKPEFNIGQSSARQTPFKWRFAGGPMMAHLKWYLAPISPHQSTIKKSLSNLDRLRLNLQDSLMTINVHVHLRNGASCLVLGFILYLIP